METVRMGVIGGGMGSGHLAYMDRIQGLKLTAFCDIQPPVMEDLSRKYNVKGFTDYRQMIESGVVDAVLVATPHYFHPDIAVYALEHGVHVLSEKPVAVHVRQAERMNRAAQKSGCVFGVMFQERTFPVYKKVKELVAAGEVGLLTRIIWLTTHSFRTQAYYNSGSWRATWAGEGGGVLLNQAPHPLDLFQWIGGMPVTVYGHAYLGKYHRIAVEDDVTAFMEYENGCTAVFITSTGEQPGTNRQELCGDRGKLVIADHTLTFYRTRQSVREFRETSPGSFSQVEVWKTEVPVPSQAAGHPVITQNFVNAILKNEPLIAPGTEGINSLALANAMLQSSLTGKPVSLPLDGEAYERLLQELIDKEKKKK